MHNGEATVLVYDCDHLASWSYVGRLLDSGSAPVPPEESSLWECPQLARFGTKWVLIVSLWNESPRGRVRYIVGDLRVVDGCPRFVPESTGMLDQGPAFYAPIVLADETRALLWGWSWELRPQAEIDEAGWAGCSPSRAN